MNSCNHTPSGLLAHSTTTTGQNNWAKDRIAPVHESSNRLQPEHVSFKRFSQLNDSRIAIPCPLKARAALGIPANGRCHWLTRDAFSL